MDLLTETRIRPHQEQCFIDTMDVQYNTLNHLKQNYFILTENYFILTEFVFYVSISIF